jgi:hypothetical protein
MPGLNTIPIPDPWGDILPQTGNFVVSFAYNADSKRLPGEISLEAML